MVCWRNKGFPHLIIFPRFSHHFPRVSNDFPRVSHDFPMVSHHFPRISSRFSLENPCTPIRPWRSAVSTARMMTWSPSLSFSARKAIGKCWFHGISWDFIEIQWWLNGIWCWFHVSLMVWNLFCFSIIFGNSNPNWLMGLMGLMVISWWFNGIYNLVDLLGGWSWGG